MPKKQDFSIVTYMNKPESRMYSFPHSNVEESLQINLMIQLKTAALQKIDIFNMKILFISL